MAANNGTHNEARKEKRSGLKRLIYLAPGPLESPSQRPHHFVEWARARWGCEVWWVEPYPVRLPRTSDLNRLRQRYHASRNAGNRFLGPRWHNAPWLHVLSLNGIPIEPLPGGRALLRALHTPARQQLLELLKQPDTWLAVGRPSGLALDLCKALQGQRVLYDVMDDMPQFSRGLSQRWMQSAHSAMLAQAGAVWGSAAQLVKSMHGQTRAAPALVRNGTVLPALPLASGATGAGTALHASAPLVLGYVGTVASWFDWKALARLAEALPGARMEIYGPLETRPPTDLPPQVRLLAPVPHAHVFGLMRHWHAGLIPFVRNTLTASVDPVKYYEYRACGLPVLTTLFGEMPHHALTDEGVWNMEDAHVLATLEQRLRLWHARLEQQQSQGMLLAPEFLKDAHWTARFDEGIASVDWGKPSRKLPG